MAEIVLDHVTKRFPDGALAVDDVNLTIADGEFVILVGPSGCGKSTTLNMIAGLEDISDGELRIDGEVANQKSPRDRDIGMVFQNYALYPHMTVRENMAFSLKLAKADQATVDERVNWAAGHPRPDRPPRPQARPALGRPAPAGRDGARHRAHPERVPDGRAALEPRRQAARADAHRGLAPAEAARHDDRLRHPRPGRGDDPGRPGRGDARRRDPAGRPARGALQPAGQPVRGRVHRVAGDELPAGDGRRAACCAHRSATCGFRTSAGDGFGRTAAAIASHHRDPSGAPRRRLPRGRQA